MASEGQVTHYNTVHKYSSSNQTLIPSLQDVRLLEQKLPHLEATHKIPNPIFSHLDFLWATDARSLVYEKVFNILEDATTRYY